MLDNYEYQMMSADARALLPMLWLLACEDADPTSGEINLELKVISFRLRRPEKELLKSIDELEACEFIDCNVIVTKPLLDSNESVTTETETETETETDNRPKATRFKPPTLEEVNHYMVTRGEIEFSEAESFIDFYSSKGWMVGKNKMKDWQAAIRNWLKRKNDGNSNGGPNNRGGAEDTMERLNRIR